MSQRKISFLKDGLMERFEQDGNMEASFLIARELNSHLIRLLQQDGRKGNFMNWTLLWTSLLFFYVILRELGKNLTILKG